MILRILVSWLLISIFGIGGITLTYAQDDVDREYDLQTQQDILGTTDSDEFMQIEKTVEKPLFDKKIVKGAHLYASDYLLKMSSYDSDWIGKNPKLLGKAIPYYTDDVSEPLGYEWKVQCLNNKDCGSIIIYTVDNKYTLLQASTNGKASYERLLADKKNKKK